MIEKIYIVECIFFDCFTGTKQTYKRFATIKEAYRFYRNELLKGFDYGDAYYSVRRPNGCFSFKEEKQPKHGLVLGHKPNEMERWLYSRPSNNDKALKSALSELRDVETPYIPKEEYLFDNEEISF